MNTTFKDFSFAQSNDLNLYFSFKILSLEGNIPKQSYREALDPHKQRLPNDYQIDCQLWSNNKPLTPVIKTIYSSNKDTKDRDSHNREWIYFPIKYTELPLNTQLCLTIWNTFPTSTKYPIAGVSYRIFSELRCLNSGRNKLNLCLFEEADCFMNSHTDSNSSSSKEDDEMDRIIRLMKKYENGDIPHIPWLDPLMKQKVQQSIQEFIKDYKGLFLYIELPNFEFPLVHYEIPYEIPFPLLTTNNNSNDSLIQIIDPEIQLDNPIEIKHRQLIRSHHNTSSTSTLKPNPKIRDQINQILKYPPTQSLTEEEKDVLFKYRQYLSQQKKSLAKFLYSVDFSNLKEIKISKELIKNWSQPQIDECLELLSPYFSSNPKTKWIRSYVVQQLENYEDDVLMIYLLQLVESLKYESELLLSSGLVVESAMVVFLTKRAVGNSVFGNYFYWYLLLKCDSTGTTTNTTQTGTYEDGGNHKLYTKVLYYYLNQLQQSNHPKSQQQLQNYQKQTHLLEHLSKITKELKQLKDSRLKKIEKLRILLQGLHRFDGVSMPLDPEVVVCGVRGEEGMVFKSHLMPLKLTFIVDPSSGSNLTEYSIIYKEGDDLKQDQLIIQLIQLMDQLLQNENLDLKLRPYKVLATGKEKGMIEFIESITLASALRENGNNLQSYFRKVSPREGEGEGDTYGIDEKVMDTYVRSCAGYCVITYLLGIGDRHLDNLLITQEGHLFHIDFGYILGRDPKPFPPPMKLCKEMVDCMGGLQSPHFQKFKSLSYSAFSILRRSSNLILNCLILMGEEIRDLRVEMDQVLAKVVERFNLGKGEEEVLKEWDGMIYESLGSVMPQLMETVHKWAQYWRK